jgi:hypothetical protein
VPEIHRYSGRRGPKDWWPSKSKEEEVKVVFRVYPEDGEVVALFPEIPGDHMGFLCMAYAHIGQHGSADIEMTIGQTQPARTEEYRDLLLELGRQGYTVLKVMKRVTRAMNEERFKQARPN